MEPLNKLTEHDIESCPIPDKRIRLFDGKGLYLEVTPKGHKWWRLKYRYNGRENRVSLGVYPQVNLETARKYRDEAQAGLFEGIKPVHPKKRGRPKKADPDSRGERRMYRLNKSEARILDRCATRLATTQVEVVRRLIREHAENLT